MITITRRQARPPARSLPPRRPGHRPPRARPAPGPPRRRRPELRGAASVTPAWPSSTSSRARVSPQERSPCRSTPWPTSRAATTRRSSSRPPPPAGPSSAGRTAASPRPASTPSPRSTRRPPSPSARRLRADARRGCSTPWPRRPRPATDDTTRYALDCLQLERRGRPRGRRHRRPPAPGPRRLRASPGRATSWSAARPSSPAGSCPATGRSRSAGPTPTSCSAPAPGRSSWRSRPTSASPTLDHVVPDAGAAATRLRLDPEDAAFLGQALDRLPGADELNAPVTLDLNGRVAVRARERGPGAGDRAGPGPLGLHRRAGPAQHRTATSWPGRSGSASPRSRSSTPTPRSSAATGPRTYCWQPLATESAIGPTDDVIRIESTRLPHPASDARTTLPKRGPP